MKKLALALALIPAIGFSEITPIPSKKDPRIKVANYDPLQIIRINAFGGINTHIQFENGEEIIEPHFGDDDGWIKIVKNNHLFIKPRHDRASSNLIVFTSKNRTYNFWVNVLARPMSDITAWVSPELTYTLYFKYPDAEATKKAEAAKEAEVKEQKEEIKERFDAVLERKFNDDYYGRGDFDILPESASDDGNFVTLGFKYNKDFPAPYAVDSEGNESKVNYHAEDNKLVLEKLVKHIMLRKGDQVAELKTYSPVIGVDNESGTVDSSVIREVNDGQ